MKNLIKALQILIKYGDHFVPTRCDEGCLYILGIDADDISDEDKTELDKLGFFVPDTDGSICSYHFGSE